MGVSRRFVVSVYTLGIWTVRPGSEDDFEVGWRRLAERTQADHPEATAVLLRDREHPGTYISFGPWDSLEQIAEWRGSPAFQESVTAIRELLENFEPHTMDPVVVVG
jgi:heme-degrading monooxygenase HmoA